MNFLLPEHKPEPIRCAIEVEPMLEIKTTPCESTAELRNELLGRVADVLRGK